MKNPTMWIPILINAALLIIASGGIVWNMSAAQARTDERLTAMKKTIDEQYADRWTGRDQEAYNRWIESRFDIFDQKIETQSALLELLSAKIEASQGKMQ